LVLVVKEAAVLKARVEGFKPELLRIERQISLQPL